MPVLQSGLQPDEAYAEVKILQKKESHRTLGKGSSKDRSGMRWTGKGNVCLLAQHSQLLAGRQWHTNSAENIKNKGIRPGHLWARLSKRARTEFQNYGQIVLSEKINILHS
jgi:hypothetical protein